MATVVEEVDPSLSDEVRDMRRQLDISVRNSERHQRDMQRMQKMMDEMTAKVKALEDTLEHTMPRLDNRLNNVEAQVSSVRDMLVRLEQTRGNRKFALGANEIMGAFKRIDAVIAQLGIQISLSSGLRVSSAKITCSCAHDAINGKIQKLARRMTQVERSWRKTLVKLGRRTRTSLEGFQEADEVPAETDEQD
ncbi:hypothetical protein VTK56DRAFT_6748 [Thermocarpiscus australiensis]